MKNRVISAVIAMTFLCLVFFQTASVVWACTCAPRDSEGVQRDFRAADVVFMGDIVSETEVIQVAPDGYTYADTTYTFTVLKAWKGVTSAQVDLVYSDVIAAPQGQPIVETSCDPWEGYFSGRMLVYARYSDLGNAESLLEPVDAGICAGTRQLNVSSEDTWEFTTLDAISSSSMQVGMPRSGESLQGTIVILIAAGMCLAAGVTVRRYFSQ